ncbi:MAG TPA: ThuA domain-containing protein, partial [Puia sp.]|nr:ThuA domain-containing protein [Puia sp.]
MTKYSGKSFSGFLWIAFLLLAFFVSAGPISLLASGPMADLRPGPMAPPRIPAFRVLVLASRASDHLKMIAAARPRLEKIASENNFTLDFTDDTSKINDANLAGYQVFVMLHLAPFDMSYAQQAALQKFVQQGKGWVGIHAAGLTGKQFLAPNSRYWEWFEEFIGGVTYSPHPKYQQATVMVEDPNHPVTMGLPDRFSISDEWYEFSTSPRSHVRVLASVDESTYRQNKPMGDHPIIWTNERYRRMIYIGVGHDPSVFDNESYTRLLTNAIQWASSISIPMKGRIVEYEKEYAWSAAPSGNAAQSGNGSLSTKERIAKAVQWLTRTFPALKDSVRRDEATGAIRAKGIFKVDLGAAANQNAAGGPGAPAHLFSIRFDIALTIEEKGYSFRAYNFYENSNEKGFSHEFSKIEYRWWDFRLNHPWYPGDRALFNGLDSTTRSLLRSLHAEEDPGATYPDQSPSYAGASSATATETSPAGLSSNVATSPNATADVYLQPPFLLHPRFRVLALYENGGHHLEYSLRARTWMNRLAVDSNFMVDYRTHTDSITPAFLANYQLILQLDYVPYGWKAEAMTAFQQYIEEGRGGWVGFHHATLLGEFDGFPIWPWFYHFMGAIRWKDYIARFAKATVRIEDHGHPIMTGIPDSFVVQKEEWYTYDKSPRPNVHVLATVDESSYQPDTAVKMGDHPVIWTNPSVRARNIYIFMGHTPILFNDPTYRHLVSNAIFWAAAGSPSSTGSRTASSPAVATPAHSEPRAVASAHHPSFRALAFFSTTVEPDHVDFAFNAIEFYKRLA